MRIMSYFSCLKKVIVIFGVVSLMYACQPADEKNIIVDVPAIINKTPQEVVKILGEPDTTYTQQIVTKRIFTQLYTQNSLEIQYPEGKATDIVVNKPLPLPFALSTLAKFGITPQPPTYQYVGEVMRWQTIPDFETVSFYVVHKDSTGKIDNYRIFFKASQK